MLVSFLHLSEVRRRRKAQCAGGVSKHCMWKTCLGGTVKYHTKKECSFNWCEPLWTDRHVEFRVQVHRRRNQLESDNGFVHKQPVLWLLILTIVYLGINLPIKSFFYWPECSPIRSCSLWVTMWGICILSIPSLRSKDMEAISFAWRSPRNEDTKRTYQM